jgi:hypothetical protein
MTNSNLSASNADISNVRIKLGGMKKATDRRWSWDAVAWISTSLVVNE